MFPSLPPVTWALLVTNGIVYLLQGLMDPALIAWFALWPLHGSSPSGMTGFLPWQIVTYSFLHGNLLHLLVNMLALYMFGSDIERVFGQRRFLIYYFVCVVTAAFAQLLVAAAKDRVHGYVMLVPVKTGKMAERPVPCQGQRSIGSPLGTLSGMVARRSSAAGSVRARRYSVTWWMISRGKTTPSRRGSRVARTSWKFWTRVVRRAGSSWSTS